MKKNLQANLQSSAVSAMDFMGAAMYYFSTACRFWVGLSGIFKAMVLPAFLVYEVLKFTAA